MADINQKTIKLPRLISIRDLAMKLELPASRIIAELIKNGVPATINEMIDFDIASIILEGMGYQAEEIKEEKLSENKISGRDEINFTSATGQRRPPIVTILGHVDHGKTTLLDAIRSSRVAEGEAGGITQRISSYQIEVESKGRKEIITFLDTPGHEAFTSLRQRGTNITDIAILIVAADDGVMPQTAEAIDLIKKSGVPMIVAINKIDKPGISIQKVKQQLAECEVFVEGWGGDVPVVEISAKEKKGIGNLLEMILLVADINEPKGNSDLPARGIVLDSALDAKKGHLVTVIILDGTLRKGDEVIVGDIHGKVKRMENYKGAPIKEAGPSCPVVIMGFKNVPRVSEVLKVQQKGITRSKIAELVERRKKTRIGRLKPLSKERIFAGQESAREFNVIIKADVPGSLEAIENSLEKINIEGAKINLLRSGIGNLTQEDLRIAKSSDAIILGFNIDINAVVKKQAEREGIVIRIHNIIYELVDELKEAISAWLGPEIIKVETGKMKIIALFGKSKKAQVVGGKMISGKARAGAIAEVFRNKESVGAGNIEEIRIGKQAVQECAEDNECGIKFSGNSEIQVGDEIVFSVEEERKRVL